MASARGQGGGSGGQRRRLNCISDSCSSSSPARSPCRTGATWPGRSGEAGSGCWSWKRSAPRRRPRGAAGAPSRPSQRRPAPLPLTRVTAVRAQEPFESSRRRRAPGCKWALAAEAAIDAAVAEGLALLNRAIHAQAVAAPTPSAPSSGPNGRPRCGSATAAARRSQPAASPRRATSTSAPRGSSARQRTKSCAPRSASRGPRRPRATSTPARPCPPRPRRPRRRPPPRGSPTAPSGLEAMLIELDGALADPAHERTWPSCEHAQRGRRCRKRGAARRPPVDDERQCRELTRDRRARPAPPPRPQGLTGYPPRCRGRLSPGLRAPGGGRRRRRADDSAMWWASSRAMPSIEGIPITVRPAARAAATPVGESSRATTSGPARPRAGDRPPGRDRARASARRLRGR